MQGWSISSAAALMLAVAAPCQAAPSIGFDQAYGPESRGERPYLQCVPYARQVSGIDIRGDAWTWWEQAAGRYERGFRPRAGAVMAFRPHGNMRLGHVAAVSRVIDARTVLLRHANWSPINGRRGRIENDVRAIDVSPDNDWSAVRVWYDPIQAIGGTAWPVAGFIYNRPLKRWNESVQLAQKSWQPMRVQLATKVDQRATTARPSDGLSAAPRKSTKALRIEYAWLD